MHTGGEAFESKAFLKTLTHRPGVYRMLSEKGELLYVGKARDLKRRVSSYFQKKATSSKTHALMQQTVGVEVTVTNTETEALLLENNLIKQHKPRFNVVWRDDKSYPYIHVSSDHDFPRLSFYRGSRRRAGRFFGPYASAYAVRATLNYLQKLFQIRQCDDSFFSHRTRPCLQYQIKRCSAPCVGMISSEDYAADVRDAQLFLEGKNREVTESLVRRMEAASGDLDFERAAHYRDQIGNLKRIDQTQFVAGRIRGDFDVIAIHSDGNIHCVAIMYIRAGRNLGSKTFFPRTAAGSEVEEVLSSFLTQYYLRHEPPKEILINMAADDTDWLQQGLSERAGHRVEIRHRVRGERARWIKMTLTNAEQGTQARKASNASVARQLEALREALDLDETPERLECFDVSHSAGESTVAGCVVFGAQGARKADYRRFNIKGLAPGDDYGAMRQALERRYTRIKRGEAPVPDILFVDGGKGQVSEAACVLEELQLDGVAIVGVAKGPARRAGHEQLFLSGRNRPLILPADSPALHLVQQIRDEAHRFAIGGHRQRRAKQRRVSILESVPGLGPKRRRELLREFGGLQGVSRAGVDDLARVKGISRKLAESIYLSLHNEA